LASSALVKGIKCRSGVFTAVNMENAFFWDVTPCGSCKNQRFGRMCRLYGQNDKNRPSRKNFSSLRCVLRPIITANFVPSWLIHVTLMMIEPIYSSETSVCTRITRSHVLEDDILHSHRRENLRSYVVEIYRNSGRTCSDLPVIVLVHQPMELLHHFQSSVNFYQTTRQVTSRHRN
jgi:predicted DNA-binding ribbon-helix-helix protein